MVAGFRGRSGPNGCFAGDAHSKSDGDPPRNCGSPRLVFFSLDKRPQHAVNRCGEAAGRLLENTKIQQFADSQWADRMSAFRRELSTDG